jgi:organic hydroperoxide reductase OsmC/OhrA
MANEHYYEVDLQWKENRKGIVTSPVLRNEHLFTAAVNSCLMTTFLAVAENSKLEFESFNSKATGKLEIVEGKYMMTEVLLEPVLVIRSKADMLRAERVLQKSEAACLISNSIKSKVVFMPSIKIAEHSF